MTSDATPISELSNLGPTSAGWLAEVGILTLDDLKRLGVVTVFLMVKRRRAEASLNLLYALHGATTGTHWAKVPASTKAMLKRRVDAQTESER